MLDEKLIKSFRNKINDELLGYRIFHDNKGKNKWSIICSAMDWIEVSIGGIDLELVSKKNTHLASRQMITFISCIDIMWEAISQLHRVLCNENGIPFKGDKGVFQQRVSDNDYFKQIRACFAAHPINLKKVFGDDNTEERWYASWSGRSPEEADFEVYLYSNEPRKEKRKMIIRFAELMMFAEKRYNYLRTLMKRFDQCVEEYRRELIKQKIDLDGLDNIEKIDVLLNENDRRMGNEYYERELKHIRIVFEVPVSDQSNNIKLVEEYRIALLPEIEEIKNNLQNMTQTKVQSLPKSSCPPRYRKAYSILEEAVWGEEQSFVWSSYIIEDLKNTVSSVVEFSRNMSFKEIYVLVRTAWYELNK